MQDKQVKEARKKCRTIASLLTDAPNPHSKGVLMFKKRRQRSKKYTLTSYGSVDEDILQDSQEEDSQFLGSESELDEEGFSAAPDPTWDSDYLEILEKRSASRGLEGNEAEDSLSTGLCDTTGRGAKLFEQQRKRAKEHAKKISIAQEQQSLMPSQFHHEIQTQEIQTQPSNVSVLVKKQVKIQPPPVAPKPTKLPELRMQEEVCATKTQITGSPLQVTPSTVIEHTPSISVPVHNLVPLTNQPITAALPTMPPPSASLPEFPASSVLNRTARPFAPGFISHRAATAPVVFRPNTAKKTPRPVSVAVVATTFSAPSDEKVIDVPPSSFTVSQISGDVPAEVSSTLLPMPTEPLPHSAIPDPATSLTPHPPSSVENIQSHTTTPSVVPDSSVPVPIATPPAGFTDPITVPSIASSQSTAPESQMTPVDPMTFAVPLTPVSTMTQLSPVVHREISTEMAPTAGGKTGILQEARRRSAIKPMFKVLENKKNSPNPELLSMVQNLDERHKHAYTDHVSIAEDSYNFDDRRGRMAPPVAPKPRIIPEMSQIPPAGGKGAELFARRQNRRDLFVVDSAPTHLLQQQQQHYTEPKSTMAMIQPGDSSWKYSPNVRAPPPIGYNPLLSPSCPLVLQRGGAKGTEIKPKVGKSGHGIQKEGIRAIDFMRRQPYQLNSAMFRFGGNSSTQSSGSSYQRQPQVGHTLSQPRQVPVKAARVYEIKRFSTPTPMSAPTICPTVITPRAQTSLAEPLCRSDMTSPTPAPVSPPPQPVTAAMSARAPGLPELPKISATPIFLPTPYSPPASLSSMSSQSCQGLQSTKQFKSAPELSSLPPVPLKPTTQAPKPRFIATRVGIQPHIWRPGAV